MEIENKESLNGHYCLATKEHYNQLVKDGYKAHTLFPNQRFHPKYLTVNGGFVSQHQNLVRQDFLNYKSMHLHNNEWVFGSLEHKEPKMNKYFSIRDAKNFFDEKTARFIWNRATRYTNDTKKLRRRTMMYDMHVNVIDVEQHFLNHNSSLIGNQLNKDRAKAYLDVIMPQMEEFKKYIGELEL